MCLNQEFVEACDPLEQEGVLGSWEPPDVDAGSQAPWPFGDLCSKPWATSAAPALSCYFLQYCHNFPFSF